MKKLSKELGITVLHVTHSPEEALALADRIAVMIDHTIAQVAKPDELFRKPTNSVVANFLGISNILPVDIFNGEVCTVAGEKIHATNAGGSTSYLWIGPEEILLSKTPFSSSARNQFECVTVAHDNRDTLLAVDLKCRDLLLILGAVEFLQPVEVDLHGTFRRPIQNLRDADTGLHRLSSLRPGMRRRGGVPVRKSSYDR